MIEDVPAAALLFSPADGRIVDSNQAARALGFAPGVVAAECLARPEEWAEFVAALAVPGAAPVSRWVELAEGAGRHRLRGKPGSGGRAMVLVESEPVGDDLFRMLAEHSEDVLWAMRPDGTFIYCSPSAEQLRGYTGEEVARQSLDQVLTPDSLAVALDRMAMLLNDNIEMRRAPMVLEQWCKDGSTVWTEVIGSPMIVDGRLVGFCGVTRDISARREWERQILAAKEAAEALAAAKSQFLAMVSHEIRTPMNGILGMARLLLDEPLLPGQRDRLDTLTASAEALLVLLDDILDLSRLEAGRVEYQAAPFHLRSVVASLMALMAGRADGKDLQVTADLDPGVPDWVRGDAGRLRQILINLVGNAVKFTAAGRVSLHVAAAGDGLVFTVADTGIGIDPAAQARLFEPFFQADSSVSRRFGGTGLGLAICKRLVEAQGGEIGVDSEPGKGSRFHVRLPYPPAAAPAAVPAAERPPLPPLSILLAEDNPVNRKVAIALLSRWGHRVETAEDGRAAVAAAARGGFDVVLMDMRMPDMDGLAATAAIRRLDPSRADVPIIALTANAMDGDAERCRAAGMDAHVAKPIDTAHLLDTIAAVLAARRQG